MRALRRRRPSIRRLVGVAGISLRHLIAFRGNPSAGECAFRTDLLRPSSIRFAVRSSVGPPTAARKRRFPISRFHLTGERDTAECQGRIKFKSPEARGMNILSRIFARNFSHVARCTCVLGYNSVLFIAAIFRRNLLH